MRYQGKYFAPSNRRPIQLGSILMRVAAVLVCLIFVTIHLMSGLFARYTTSGGASDSARVAKFEVDVLGESSNHVSISDIEVTDHVYTFTVTNRSEVAVDFNCSVSITRTDVQGDLAPATGYLDPGESVTVSLTFSVTDWNAVTASMEGQNGTVYFDFSVSILVEQVD